MKKLIIAAVFAALLLHSFPVQADMYFEFLRVIDVNPGAGYMTCTELYNVDNNYDLWAVELDDEYNVNDIIHCTVDDNGTNYPYDDEIIEYCYIGSLTGDIKQ